MKTASATVYAYRFHSCILPPKSQFLAAKNVCYCSLAKHLKTEIYHSCSFSWQIVLCFLYSIFSSIQLILWMSQIPKDVWEVKNLKPKQTKTISQPKNPDHPLPFFFLYLPWKFKHPFFCNNAHRQDGNIVRPKTVTNSELEGGVREQVRRNLSSWITLTFRSKFLLNQSKP